MDRQIETFEEWRDDQISNAIDYNYEEWYEGTYDVPDESDYTMEEYYDYLDEKFIIASKRELDNHETNFGRLYYRYLRLSRFLFWLDRTSRKFRKFKNLFRKKVVINPTPLSLQNQLCREIVSNLFANWDYMSYRTAPDDQSRKVTFRLPGHYKTEDLEND